MGFSSSRRAVVAAIATVAAIVALLAAAVGYGLTTNTARLPTLAETQTRPVLLERLQNSLRNSQSPPVPKTFTDEGIGIAGYATQSAGAESASTSMAVTLIYPQLVIAVTVACYAPTQESSANAVDRARITINGEPTSTTSCADMPDHTIAGEDGSSADGPGVVTVITAPRSYPVGRAEFRTETTVPGGLVATKVWAFYQCDDPCVAGPAR